MFGEKRIKLITIQCVCCGKWHVVRVDPDDLERHVKGGIYVQHAFTDRDGKSYLSPYSRELFISKCCRSCWRALPQRPAGLQLTVTGAKMPRYNRGDFVKVEFANEATGVAEWLWLRVSRCDDHKQLVFGTLDSQPLNDYDGQIGLGSELAVSFSQIREHRKPTEFTSQ